jgi:hypothetical protein
MVKQLCNASRTQSEHRQINIAISAINWLQHSPISTHTYPIVASASSDATQVQRLCKILQIDAVFQKSSTTSSFDTTILQRSTSKHRQQYYRSYAIILCLDCANRHFSTFATTTECLEMILSLKNICIIIMNKWISVEYLYHRRSICLAQF